MPITKIVFIILLSVSFGVGCSPVQKTKNSAGKPPLFSEEIQTLLDQERKSLHQEMKNPVYVETLHTANAEKKKISPKAILQLEQQWSAQNPDDVLAQTVLNSACSEQLRAFRSANSEFAEMFITDGQGRNVCLTNKTSNYYQAEEDWWISTYASGDPYGLHSPIEFDESSSTESISLTLPILDPSTGSKLGILKAVVKLSRLTESL